MLAQGEFDFNETAVDTLFGVQAPENGIVLKRNVQMYQWVQSVEFNGKAYEYKYKKVWSDKLIRSRTFKRAEKHKNPDTMPLISQTFFADAMLKEYQVPESYFGDLSERLPSISIDGSNIVNVPKDLSMLKGISREGSLTSYQAPINEDAPGKPR